MLTIVTDLRQNDIITDPRGEQHTVTFCRVVPGVAVHFRTDTGADVEHSWDYARAVMYDVTPRTA